MLRQHPIYSVSYEASKSTCRVCNSSFGFWTCLLVGRGDDDDTVTQTPPNKISRRAVLLGTYSTFVMWNHPIYSPNLLLDFANSTLGFWRDFGRKLEIGWGEDFFGDDHDTVSLHPEQYLHTLARAHTTHHFKSKPSYAEVWALRVLASPSHARLASCLLMFIRCCASGFRSVKFVLAAPAFCTVFTAFSYHPTTCDLAVSSPSSLQLQLLSQFWGRSLCNFTRCDR